jgi:hypothetical protein
MPNVVQRFIFRGKPRKDNRKYNTWESASVVVFVCEADHQKAMVRFHELLEQHRWELVRMEDKSTLIEERVREQGGDVLEAYETALERGYFLIEFPENFGAGKKKNFGVFAPRIGEDFVDGIIEKAGGRRLTEEEKNFEITENADYLVDNFVIELKELREEALVKTERQERIAKLFAPYYPTEEHVDLDPSILTEADQLKYLDLVGRPIQNQIKKAAKQLKRTKKHVKQDSLRGAVIMMNTGYATLPPDLFEALCLRYATKDTSQIDELFCISSWFLCNGFDSEVFFQFAPRQEDLSPLGKKLFEGYNEQLNEFMGSWFRSGFGPQGDMHSPMEAIAFNYEGQVFSWLPPKLQKSYEKERNESG